MAPIRFLSLVLLAAVTLLNACGDGVLADGADAPNADAAPVGGDAAPVAVCLADQDTPAVGTWYLNASGARWTVTVGHDAGCQLAATLVDEGGDGTAEVLQHVTWSGTNATLGFQRLTDFGGAWVRAQVVAGVLQGRMALVENVPGQADYTSHVTGWNAATLDVDIAPRTYELTIAGGAHAVLRIDHGASPHAPWQGRIKVYATDADGAAAEEDSYDLDVQQWDGQKLVARSQHGTATWTYRADVTGRLLHGQLDHGDGSPSLDFDGARADVLGYGLRSRPNAARDAWQTATRLALTHLTMADNPQPLTATTAEAPLQLMLDPVTNDGRDDNPDAWPQAYTLTDVQLTLTLPSPDVRASVQRVAHLVVARPMAPPPPGGYPIALALNGHYGSALGAFSPNGTYWYADAFARRGYVVVALDVGHRPLTDRAALYGDMTGGDDPVEGNQPHPAIAVAGLDSDWEEDGERAWDAMRALDYAVRLPDVNGQRIVAVGLSMGGEVATQVAALDTRVTAAVVAGYAPDLGVMLHHNNHPCWQWQHADIREFVDISDHEALVAPRGLIVETGAVDTTFSLHKTPFSADKQVLRRTRAAFQGAPHKVLHYLHVGAHAWHAGDIAGSAAATTILRPVEIAPTRRWSLQWQDDARTRATASTVFDTVDAMLSDP